jgi:hypothetical protein
LKIGKKYRLFGTDTLFEVKEEDDDFWVITVRSSRGDELGVLMRKVELTDAIIDGALKDED